VSRNTRNNLMGFAFLVFSILCVLALFGAWWVGIWPAGYDPGTPVICPVQISGAQMAVITRRRDTVTCMYDGGRFVSESILHTGAGLR
jgi:hypothetical protein